MARKSLTELINDLEVESRRLAWVKEKQKEVQARYDKLRLIDIPNAMAEQDIRSVTGQFGKEETGFKTRCTLTRDMHIQTLDQPRLFSWLNESGNGPMIIETVNASTLKAFITERQKNRSEIPDEKAVKVSPFMRAVLYT